METIKKWLEDHGFVGIGGLYYKQIGPNKVSTMFGLPFGKFRMTFMIQDSDGKIKSTTMYEGEVDGAIAWFEQQLELAKTEEISSEKDSIS